MVLEKEMAVYERELPRLLAERQEGKHAVVVGDTYFDTWVGFDAAIRDGYRMAA
jgi:hypothetical protein